MKKEDQIKYLEEMLIRDIKLYLESETQYRVFRSLSLGTKNQQIWAAETKLKEQAEAGKLKIEADKEVLKELNDGKLVI